MIAVPLQTFASEADLTIPAAIKGENILYFGFLITLLGMLFGFLQYLKIKKLPAHGSMLEIADVIYKTCSAYLKLQGKFLSVLFIFIGAAVAGYFGFLAKDHEGNPLLELEAFC